MSGWVCVEAQDGGDDGGEGLGLLCSSVHLFIQQTVSCSKTEVT